MKVNKWIAFLLPLLFASCPGKEKLDGAAFVKWVDNVENGLVRKKTVGGFFFEARYRPAAYEQARALARGEKINSKLPADDGYYFTLKAGTKAGDLTRWNTTDMVGVQQNIYYLSFTMQDDIRLIDGKDTLKCVHYVYERIFGIAGHKVFNIGFEPEKWNTGDKTLIIDGNYFGIVPVKLKFRKEDLDNLPGLKR